MLERGRFTSLEEAREKLVNVLHSAGPKRFALSDLPRGTAWATPLRRRTGQAPHQSNKRSAGATMRRQGRASGHGLSVGRRREAMSDSPLRVLARTCIFEMLVSLCDQSFGRLG